ncbi:MAG: P-loop NTPase [Candidatus Nanohaloarchaea archaeon]
MGSDRAIGVFSGKGGVGKTVSAVNLALALQDHGEETVCIDGDVNAPNIALQLGLEPDRTALSDPDVSLDSSLYVHDSGLLFVPSTHLLSDRAVDADRMRDLAGRLHGTAVVDAPPGFARPTRELMAAVDEAVVVTTPERPAVRDAEKTLALLDRADVDVAGLLVIRADQGPDIDDRFDAPVLGRVPAHAAVRTSIAAAEPLLTYRPYSPASLAYREAAAELAGVDYRPPSFPWLRKALHRLR